MTIIQTTQKDILDTINAGIDVNVSNAIDPNNFLTVSYVGVEGTTLHLLTTDADGDLQIDVKTMPSVVVSSTNLDIRDLTSASDSVSIIKEKGSTIAYGNIGCTTSATLIKTSNASRLSIVITNISIGVVYIGGSSVTTSTGTPLQPNQSINFDNFVGSIYGRTASGTLNVRYIEID